MPPEGRPTTTLRIALAPDAPLVLAGLKQVLGQDAGMLVVDLPPATRPGRADVVLYDPSRGLPEGCATDGTASRDRTWALVALSWTTDPDVVRVARSHGARGLVSKELGGPALVTAIRDIHGARPDEFLVAAGSASRAEPPAGPVVDLTPREAEILGLITEGLSNDEIAKQLYLSINSVKTYIRTGYRKIGVTRRSQAVLWGVHHGMGSGDPVGVGVRS